ncbi:unnamed protein product [Microthlaspi erraticum]|uniref:RNase H type-1 domain-containing protein n=1 Tax=Microthlaspi erraticum TaxID=1685480 RepID=A0A6D2I248_9BRAS|nr:unnamed protein product [Microthlaspi erraticum]
MHELPEDYQSIQPINWISVIWQGKFSPKMKVFLWKTIQEALPVGENLLNRGLLDNACCIHCGELETTEHLFFRCPYASEVWIQTPLTTTVNPNQNQTFAETLIASRAWTCLPPTGLGSGPLFPWICWSIWKARNTLIFEDRRIPPTETVLKAIREAKDWQSAQILKKSVTKSFTSPNPQPGESGIVTCFSDGAWCKDTGIGGFGWIFVDTNRAEVNRGSSAERFVTSSLMAEALSIRSALNHTLEEGISNIHLKSDSQDLIRALNMHVQIKEIYDILFDIHSLASLFTSIWFGFVPRSENASADSIAKFAKCRLISSSSSGPHPSL